jgi:DeoR/GlpR family transcriptional regulator of sugar metabolism
MLSLNNPDTREAVLLERLSSDGNLIATNLAHELDISIHTIRRDLISLEQKGLVRRVRGGAVPITKRGPDYLVRAEEGRDALAPIAARAATLIPLDGTVYFDGGTTMDMVAKVLPEAFDGLIVTPAPSVALIAMGRGVRVRLIGGTLCSAGAIATGADAERTIQNIAADMCLLGACGLWSDFGLSAEEEAEAGVKRAMALAATQVVVVTSGEKFHRKGHHRVLATDEIDAIVTDAPDARTMPFAEAEVEIIHV